MTYHDLSPELQEKVRANTIAERIRNGKTKKEANRFLNGCIASEDTVDAFFLFHRSPEGKYFWRDVMNGKIK